ncbi:fimbrial protein [Pseudomonas aeruginosa]|nr:fimbrial protein [Pseudomonas aeruginosa]
MKKPAPAHVKLLFCIGISTAGCLWSLSSVAYCGKPELPTKTPLPIQSLQSVFTLKHAPIGKSMGTMTVQVGSGETLGGWAWCGSDGKPGQLGFTAPKTTLIPIDGNGLYESGVPGVGIRIGHRARYNWTEPTAAPATYPTGNIGTIRYMPTVLVVDFIRTAMGVGKGDITPFNYSTNFFIDTNYTNPSRAEFTIEGYNLRATLEHNAFFTTCSTQKSTNDVNMGRPTAYDIKRGAVPDHGFSLDVVCEGLNPSVKPPVKVYFEGNSIQDGLLNLTGRGEAGVAQGVGISLTSSKGAALPFTQARALPLDWLASGAGTEMYRFVGSARYVATGGKITAGKADSILTYILEYN